MPKQRRFGRIKLFFAVVFVAAVAFGGLLWLRTQEFADRPLLLDNKERVLVVERGDGFVRVLAKIRALGVDQGGDLEWKALATSMKVAQRLQVGDYGITSGMTPRNLLQRLEDGAVIQRKFTIIDGWSFRDVRKALAADPLLVHQVDALSDAEIMAKLGRGDRFPEGRFLPETYVYTRGTSDLAMLDRAAKAMDVALDQAWEGRDKDVPLSTPDELLTLASIVEKETGLASDRPMIAGVFARRLKLGMLLQTDPTVIYGMGSSYAGNIRKADLTTDTPYNTYTRKGPPPTPIAMPGRASLAAAANPAGGDALYFVARGKGASHFSATYQEHAEAVRKYQMGH